MNSILNYTRSESQICAQNHITVSVISVMWYSPLLNKTKSIERTSFMYTDLRFAGCTVEKNIYAKVKWITNSL